MKTFTHDGGDVGIRGIFGGYSGDFRRMIWLMVLILFSDMRCMHHLQIMQDMPVYGREGSEYNPDNIK